jgi:hypothetical protein
VPDNNPPYQPTPCPPDHTKPVGYVRHATLPVQSIADEVNNQTSVNAWVDWNGNPGAYLCEYMAYLGMWYQDIHNDTSNPDYCLAAGFIHVNAGVVLKNAMEATNVTIREVIKYLLSSNQPPGKPTIEGPEYGDTSIEYEYRISVSDPDGDNISIYVDWGDGNIEEWVGPIKSGDNVTCNHSWMEKGSYTIKVKARDELGAEGPWGTYRVIIGVYIGIGEVTGGVLKISVNFENPSKIDAKNINWSIDLDGGLIVFGKETTGIIDILSGENKTVQSKFILGFGKTTITITATHKETSYTRDHNGYLLLFFIYINPSGFD